MFLIDFMSEPPTYLEFALCHASSNLLDIYQHNVPNFCRNDELSCTMSLVGCLLTDSDVFILFAEINQILLKISFIPILLTFMNLAALYQKTELKTISLQLNSSF